MARKRQTHERPEPAIAKQFQHLAENGDGARSQERVYTGPWELIE